MDNKLLLLLAVGMILLALLIVLVDRRRTKKTMNTIEQMQMPHWKEATPKATLMKAAFLRWKPSFPITSPPVPSPHKM